MRTTIERELKLEPREGFVLPPLPGQPLEPRLFTSTYHDSPIRSLTRAGITLRRRVENGVSLWQLKLPREAGRAEIEAAGGPRRPPDEIAALLVAHLRHGALAPVATLRTRRAGTRVMEDGRPIADVTFDSVDVLEGGRLVEHFDELEIELVDGAPGELDRLGKVLRRAGAAAGDGRPKVMRVLGETADAPTGRSTGALLRTLLSTQLRELEAHDPGVRLGDDPEDLHRFRVATRRTRALARATKPLLGETLAPLAGELAWLAGLLGPVRDLDVLIERVRAEARDVDADQAATDKLAAALAVERDLPRAELLQALASARYLKLLASFGDAIESLSEVDTKTSVRRIARSELARLRKAADALPPDPPDNDLHVLRIRAKRARYAAELAGLKRQPRELERYIDALKRLQDVIGEHQDSVVAEAQLRRVARAATAIAAGRLIERERERRRDRRRRYPAVLAKALDLGGKALG